MPRMYLQHGFGLYGGIEILIAHESKGAIRDNA